jgi:ATP-binding protein involved in chromosome partitioning
MGSVPKSTPPPTDAIRETLRGVVDPELGDNVVDLGMVRGIEATTDGAVTVHFALTVASCPLRSQLDNDIVMRVSAMEGVTSVTVQMAEMTSDEKSALMGRARWKARENAPTTRIAGNTRVIAISSGKGGVGKSSVTVNLAAALAMRGLTVGVLDADIAGFTVPKMFGITQRLEATEGSIRPFEKPFGKGQLKVVSMGLIEGSGEEEAIMLRGLMLNRALQHFLEDVAWGDLDYLIIDMPTGTGDVQMGLARMLPRADMIVVTTPALAAQQVAARAVDMARRGYLRVAGIVENMSAFVGDDGKRYELFGKEGGQRLATKTGAPLLAQIPFDTAMVDAGDNGEPLVVNQSGKPITQAFTELAELIVTEVVPVVEMSGCTTRLLDAAAATLGAPVSHKD